MSAALLLAGCPQGNEPENVKTPGTHETTSLAQQVVNGENIRVLCDFFYTRPHEVLLTPGAEGNATTLASAQGIRPELQRAVADYYKGNVTLKSLDGKRILDERYARVITECQKSGWKP